MNSQTDPSRRYILASEAPYLNNLAMLWEQDAGLASQIDALELEPYPVDAARSGDPTLSIEAEDGARVFLHSRFEPLREARQLAESISIENHLLFYVQGFGLGYHVEALLERIGPEAAVCIFEPDIRLLKTAMSCRDLSGLLEGGRVQFFVNADKGEIFSRLQPQMAALSMGCAYLTHAPSLRARPTFHGQVRTWLDEYEAYSRTSLHTMLVNGQRTARNIAWNLGWYVASPGLSRLKDRHKGAPAVVVSAGPSLRKNKHLLKGLERNAVLVAVQTTLRPLLEMGVEPQYVTSLDHHDISTRFFENLPARLNTELVAEPKATDKIFRMYPGPMTVIGSDFAQKLLKESPPDKGFLRAGATVAHLAYYLAEYMGCDPIIFVGQDLGFSDGLCYAPGTSYDDVWRPELGRFCTLEMKQWEQIVRDRRILRRVPDIEGRGMYTEERLYTYLQQFERDFLQSDRTLIDATEGGAMKRGTKIMRLADAIAHYCVHPLAAVPTDHPGMRWDRVSNAVESLNHRRREAREIEEISRQTLPMLEELRDHIADQARVNQLIAGIDTLHARMNQYGACYDLVLQLNQSAEMDRFKQDRRISADGAIGLDLQRRQVQRDIRNVQSIVDAAGRFVQLMDDAAAQMVLLADTALGRQEAA